MKKSKKAPTGAACTSTMSGGALTCVLHGEHATHSTSTDGRRARQYATWSTLDDGRVRVITYSAGKKMSEWFEAAGPAPAPARDEKLAEVGYCGEKFESYSKFDVCTLTAKHVGLHQNTSTGVREIDVDSKPLPSDWPEEPEDDDRAARWECETSFVGDDKRDRKCEARNEHNGPHYAYCKVLGRTVNEEATASSVPAQDDDDDEPAPTEDEPDELEMRTLARQQREEREAHAAKVEAEAKSSSLTDTCAKCGLELGEHDGKKCPKLAKAKKAKPATKPKEVSIGTFPVTPIAADDDRLVRGQRILGYRRHPAAKLFPLLEGEDFERFADRIQANGLRDAIELVTIDGETWILDGSNRGLACLDRGVTPHFKHYEGPTDMDSLVAYSFDKNGDGRRHLDPSVRALIAADAAKLGRGNPCDRQTGRSAGLMTQAEAGKRLNVSERLVRRAVVVRDKGTTKVREAVMKGRLSVEAAEQVTRLPKAKQDEIADEALARKSGSVKGGRVRALVKQEEKRAVVRKINEQRVPPMPGGEYGVIYADYPWKYDNSDQHDGSRGHMGYPPMTMDEILAHAREAATRAAKSCIVALWTTNLYIPQVGRVVEAYGAEHRTVWTWPKPHIGVGTWGRGQTEHLVIASIGAPVHTLNEVSTLLRSYKPHHVGEHSSKPIEVADLLRKHCSGPFLELFAKERREGWASWGAEVDKFATEAA